MKTSTTSSLWFHYLLLVLLGAVLIFSQACKMPDYPPSVYDPDYTQEDPPVIYSIIPLDSTWAQIGEILIRGEKFSTSKYNNLVFFGTATAEVVSASDTVLVVKSPNTTGDSLDVKVARLGAEEFSEAVTYKLLPPIVEVRTFDDAPYGIDLSSGYDVYVSLEGKGITKITAAGDPVDFATTGFLKAAGMKVGPGGTLYAAWDLGRSKGLTMIDSSGVSTDLVKRNKGNSPRDLDFDSNGNLWVAAGTDLVRLNSVGTETIVRSFSYNLICVRIFSDHVYVLEDNTAASEYEATIWRMPFVTDTTLGDPEEVVDLGAATWLGSAHVNAFTFSADNDIYLATNGEVDALFRYDPASGDYASLYPGVLGRPEYNLYALSWGEKSFLYASQQVRKGAAKDRVIKIDVQFDRVRRFGAPYYGRGE